MTFSTRAIASFIVQPICSTVFSVIANRVLRSRETSVYHATKAKRHSSFYPRMFHGLCHHIELTNNFLQSRCQFVTNSTTVVVKCGLEIGSAFKWLVISTFGGRQCCISTTRISPCTFIILLFRSAQTEANALSLSTFWKCGAPISTIPGSAVPPVARKLMRSRLRFLSDGPLLGSGLCS
ncbi:hypothetical protein BJ742DRAFT_249362 [Cladochytrium replicatum]|nr:hypothetical protein BJ742DRAFT_249362 [Cladochytrium replicatum]